MGNAKRTETPELRAEFDTGVQVILAPLPSELFRAACERRLRGWGHHESVASLDRERWIYFIQGDDCGPIKIGHTRRLAHRLEDLDGAYPFGTLRVVGLLLGSVALESEAHRRFADLRIKGEWFRPAMGLLDFIRSLPLGGWP